MSGLIDEIYKSRKQLKRQAITNAIISWQGYRSGKIAPGQTEPYDPVYCDIQITYFKLL